MTDVPITELGEKGLAELSRKMLLSLDAHEMRAIQDYYKGLGREPAQIELETIAQTWSEHCKHKTFSARISYTEGKSTEEINGLFREFIKKPTQESTKNWLVSVFSDNAGIISFNGSYNIAAKVETHNHPSALDPYGGANTGLGGVLRDVLGAGLGAQPFANTDVFCFAPPTYPAKNLPKGVLHPKRVFKGVRQGVADYGNRVGIATVNGAILFDERYLGNPLVYCGTVGLIPKGFESKAALPGDAIVVIGGKTGRDGIHGATFSSARLDQTASSSAVQIGNPIEEKKMMDAILKARDLKLYNAITDCGAGGFSSAVGEMGAKTGARVWLDKAPLKYRGLEPWEIWLSEAQERMVLAVPKQNFGKLAEICKVEGTEATIIGEFTDTKKLELFYKDEPIGELGMAFLHEGVPQKSLKAEWRPTKERELAIPVQKNTAEKLRGLLSMPNIASKEKTVRKYDHEVRGGVVGKPFTGAENDGPADAAIVRPLLNDWQGTVISCGINPFYSDLDAYWMGRSCVDEAVRNAVCIGADFERIALLDNFSWGSPDNRETLGALVRACMGIRDSSKALDAPFISGKDSLYNEYVNEKTRTRITIPGTLLITAIGTIPDSRKKVSMPFKKPGNPIFIVGNTYSEMGGSHYAKLLGAKGGFVPKIGQDVKDIFSKLSKIMLSQGALGKVVVACHDCSEGGLGVAVAEMCFASGFGGEVFLQKVPLGEPMVRDDFILFSESNSRFIVEVEAERKEEFRQAMHGVPFSEIGYVTETGSLIVRNLKGGIIIDEKNKDMKKAWKGTLWW